MRSASPSVAADFAHCRAILREGSRSFDAASRLLPRGVRDAASAVYAFCRAADDAVDTGSATPETIAGLRRRLAGIYGGTGHTDPVDRALARVVAAHGLPQTVFEALLDGFAWEVEGRRYETIEEVRAYSVRVASTVGVAMSCLLGRRDPEVLARATDLGIAMQLTNIARDVGEDARTGRLYLPRAWMREAGLDPDAWLRHPTFSPPLGGVVRRLLDEADTFYRRADAGIAALPAWSRPAIRAARLIYADIGRVIAAAGYDSVRSRAVTSGTRKIQLALRALLPLESPSRKAAAAPEARFLVDAAAHPRTATTTHPPLAPSDLPRMTTMHRWHDRLESALTLAAARLTGGDCPPRLADAIRYAVFPPGNRLRPQLCFAVADALGDPDPASTDAAAVALEFLHGASLIQDDLPAFDAARERRGRPALHHVFGESLAVLAADALIIGAFEVLAEVGARDPRKSLALTAAVARGVNASHGAVAGQAWEDEESIDLERYHRAKTAALFEAATAGGAIAAGYGAAPWREVGTWLGRAYQIADDIDDAEAQDAGSDAALGRPNALQELGSASSFTLLDQCIARAFEAVPPAPGGARFDAFLRGLVSRFREVARRGGRSEPAAA